MKKRIIYRDRKSGRFASRSSWRRSRAQGGKRYIRERLKIPPVTRRKAAPSLRPAALPVEFIRPMTQAELAEIEEEVKQLVEGMEPEDDLEAEEEIYGE